jgi:cyclin B
MQKKFERKERAAAVDWLVQIQESFELNHETMYMAVKLMDLYVHKVQPNTLVKSMLQLIPCVAVFIASKFEVYIPVCLKYLYILGTISTNYRGSALLMQKCL